jgi:hypothetical protein
LAVTFKKLPLEAFQARCGVNPSAPAHQWPKRNAGSGGRIISCLDRAPAATDQFIEGSIAR